MADDEILAAHADFIAGPAERLDLDAGLAEVLAAEFEITESPVTTPPNYWMDTHVDEDGTEVPGHWVVLSHMRDISFTTECEMCRHTHGVTTRFFHTLNYPEAIEKIREECRKRLIREVTTPHTAPPARSV
ncbi:hypothetical protein [Nocardia asiatica]|uniref:hypothetical protein n=1 Tax=Nocardia asiatica TaxID=209252 RepID=UPI0024547A00|nr:hypothetical protein [Nocardia asiatica]